MREIKPTQKDVPSSDVKDLFFNSGKIDEWVNSLQHEYTDRFGKCHKTAAGMEWVFNKLVERFKIDALNAILAAGYAPVGTFQEGAEVKRYNETVLWKLPDGDGEYYRWDGDLPKSVPENSAPSTTGGIKTTDNPDGLWVSVGNASLRTDMMQGNGKLLGLSYNGSEASFDANEFAQLTVYADPFIKQHMRVIDGIHAACDYVRKRGGGYVYLSAKTYLLEDELIPRDTVMIKGVGNGQWNGHTTLKWAGGDGTDKCVVRASKDKLGLTTNNSLSMSGCKNCYIDADGCDVGFYAYYSINDSDFSGLTVRNATKANVYILKSWFCKYENLNAVFGKGKGIVIGHPLFGETGQMNVNACGFTTIKAHTNGVDTVLGSTDKEDGAGVILGKYMTGNNFRSIQSESNSGIGLLAYSTFTNSICSMYIEKNAAKLSDEYKYCGLMYEHGGSFSTLSISSIHLATNQYITNNVDLGLVILALGRNDNINTIKGTGRILLASSNLRQFSATDFSKVASDNIELLSGKNLNTRYTTSFDSMSLFVSEEVDYPHVIIVPRSNYSFTKELTLRFDSQSSSTGFGTDFIAGEPVIRRYSPLKKGFQHIKITSPTGNSDAFFDVYVVYGRERMGGQGIPRLTL